MKVLHIFIICVCVTSCISMRLVENNSCSSNGNGNICSPPKHYTVSLRTVAHRRAAEQAVRRNGSCPNARHPKPKSPTEAVHSSNDTIVAAMRRLVDRANAPGSTLASKQSALDMFKTGHRQCINCKRHAELRRQVQDVSDRRADGASVTNSNNILAGVINRVLVNSFSRSDDQVGETLPTRGRIAGWLSALTGPLGKMIRKSMQIPPCGGQRSP